MTAESVPPPIDSREFTRRSLQLQGETPVSALPRLASLLSRDDSSLAWRVTGSRRRKADGGDVEAIDLVIEGEVMMPCVRCLAEVAVKIGVHRSFRLVASEQQAAREDLEDPDFDVLASSPRFDLCGLIEDEALLSLPALARHESCEAPRSAALGTDRTEPQADPDGSERRPFAVLESLRKGRS